ncbi:hypothetical protein I547_4159 [Mycobacterium kansasii 824]|nr:hypothetical protein I547_4159 [Mycobacterium kansasii 824]
MGRCADRTHIGSPARHLRQAGPGRAMHQLNPSRVVFPMFAQRIHAEPDCDAGRMD